MQELIKNKVAVAVVPQVANGGAATNVAIDTATSASQLLLVEFGAMAVDATVKVTESATTGGTYTDIPGTTFTAAAAAYANKAAGIFLNKSAARLQFLKVVVTAGAGNVSVSAVALLGDIQGNMPSTAAEMGLQNLVSIV